MYAVPSGNVLQLDPQRGGRSKLHAVPRWLLCGLARLLVLHTLRRQLDLHSRRHVLLAVRLPSRPCGCHVHGLAVSVAYHDRDAFGHALALADAGATVLF